MPLKIKFKGRTMSSTKALIDAMSREVQTNYEKELRRAAASAGVAIKKSGSNFEIEGTQDQIERFNKRLGS
jgi:hypothetical protein